MPESSFRTGRAVVDLGGTDDARDVVVQPDGKIVVVGTSNDDFALVRLHPDGSLDTSFDGDGKVFTTFGAIEAGRSVALHADGKIVVGGTANGNFALARYNADGSLDTTFDGDGRVTVDFGGEET